MSVQVERGTPIARVVLNRPERRNAVTLDMWRALAGVFKELGEDGDVRAIILHGEGGDFCAGADISEFETTRGTAEQVRDYDEAVDTCCDAIAAAPKPVIAAVRGYCFGGGCGLAMACDFRIAEPAAVFSIPAARLSIVYGMRETQNLLALVGLANAKRILYGAERIDAPAALAMGLIDEVADDPLKAASERCQHMARNAPLSIAGAKAILTGLAMGMGTLDEADALSLGEAASQSDDHREARAAFRDRREPVFKGS